MARMTYKRTKTILIYLRFSNLVCMSGKISMKTVLLAVFYHQDICFAQYVYNDVVVNSTSLKNAR